MGDEVEDLADETLLYACVLGIGGFSELGCRWDRVHSQAECRISSGVVGRSC